MSRLGRGARVRAGVLVVSACLAALGGRGAFAQEGLARWEADIRAFEAEDRREGPAGGGVVFAGSSSIRLWKSLREDFPGLDVVNRGFGGSRIREVTAFAGRVILPRKPRLIVFYCGTNDIASGRSAREVFADYRQFVETIHAALPTTRIAFIAAAPNPARWHLRARFRDLNGRVAAWSRTDARLAFVDVWPHMLGADGRPRPDIFVEDRLHMNEKGYAIWARVVGEAVRSLDPGAQSSSIAK